MAASHGRPGVSRRHLLQLALGAGVGGPLLAGCGRPQPANERPSGGRSSRSAGGQLSGEVTFAFPLGTEGVEDFYTGELGKFAADNGITVTFMPFPGPQYAQSLQALFQSGEAPDVYRMAQTPALMVPSWEKDWIQPLDDYPAITDMLANDYGKSALDPAVSGLHIDGKLWAVPGLGNNKINGYPLMINPKIFDQYGVDVPQTWSAYREAAAKITTDSGGDVAGIVFVTDGSMLTTTELTPLSDQAGPVRRISKGVMVDQQTGKAAASHSSLVDAVALLRGFVEDGSVLSGWQNINPQAFFQVWAAGKAAMTPTAAWWLTQILKIDPKAPYEIVELPLPDSGRGGYMTVGTDWIGAWGMSKSAQNTEAAAALIGYLGSAEFQRVEHEAISSTVSLAEGMTDILDEHFKQVLEVSSEVIRRGPSPSTRSNDTNKLLADVTAALPEPNFDQIAFSAVDKGADYVAAAARYDAAVQAILDEKIAAAIADGADFDENVLAFPDWDPLGDDYATKPGS